MPRIISPLTTALSLCLLLCLALPPRTLAQEEEASDEDAAAEHFARGRKLYAAGKYQEAIDELLKAYELRPAPPILLNVGRTYEKLDDKGKALEFYRKFLQKARLVDPNRETVQGMVKRLEKELGATGATGDAAAPTPEVDTTTDATAPALRGSLQLIHTPVDSAKVRKPVTIQAELPPDVVADRLTVRFRKQGETNFRELAMQRQGDAYVVKIPGKYITSTSLQYFIEATKEGEKRPVALSGERQTPHIVVIEGGRVPLAPGQELDIRSPYRTWFWVAAGGTLALIGGTVAWALLAKDRQDAVEVAGSTTPPESFDTRARDWESQGQTFAVLGKVFVGLSIAAAGATGYLWYIDRRWVERERRSLSAGRTLQLAPYASHDGGGIVGRLAF